jgi:RNA polymerase sigma-70 factor (ECF subfamily)
MKPRLTITAEEPSRAVALVDSIDTLYERYLAKVKRWARHLAGPTADLEDMVHDTFLIAFKKGFKDRGLASIETWLFRITHHVVKDRRRRRRLRALLFGQHQATLVPPSPHTPQQELERREGEARLYRALDRLPDRLRTTLVLYEIDGLSGEQVAELTGTSLGTVWVRLHRGRERLVALLAPEEST